MAAFETVTVPDQGQSQPVNEVTPIVSNSDTSRRNYHSTDGLRNRDSGSTNNNTVSRDPGQQNSQCDSEEPHGSWYSRLADRYGSLELENKGSVARDHLALGMLSPLLLCFSFLAFFLTPSVYDLVNRIPFLTLRTNLFGMAADIVSLCIDWHRSNPVISS